MTAKRGFPTALDLSTKERLKHSEPPFKDKSLHYRLYFLVDFDMPPSGTRLFCRDGLGYFSTTA